MKGTIFNLVIKATEAEIKMYMEATAIDTASVMARGDLSWCFEAYHFLVQRNNLHVTLSNCLRHYAVNIVHAAQLIEMKGTANYFVVCVQGDYPRCHWAHYNLVQNQSQLDADTAFVPHWIQPNLIRRNEARNKVIQVAYVGPADSEGVLSEEGSQFFLKSHGITLNILTGPWNDLSAVDVLVGLRSFDENVHLNKPASRLFSAWHSHVAFVGGPDSAYKQVGTPGEDYLLARSPQQVVDAILHLRYDDGLYKKLVQNGIRKTLQYNNDSIAQNWEAILSGPVMKRYLHWKAQPHYEQERFTSLLK